MGSIGIPVADREECGIALETAFTLAKAIKSDVVGVHVRPLPEPPGNINLSDIWTGAGMAYGNWYGQDAQQTREAARRARELFEKSAGTHGFPLAAEHGKQEGPAAIYREVEGEPEKMFAGFGPINDLLVVSRPSWEGGARAFLIMMSALMDSATPVLLLPQKPVRLSGKRLALGWNGGRAEALLVHTALPLLRAADDLVLITEGSDSKSGPRAKEMISYLQSHGIKARFKQAEGKDTGAALVDAAREEGAEILLSGAYTRGRMREMVFGGVTEHLITESDFPVILLHV